MEDGLYERIKKNPQLALLHIQIKKEAVMKCDYCDVKLEEEKSIQFVIEVNNDELRFCSASCLNSYDIVVKHYERKPYGTDIKELR